MNDSDLRDRFASAAARLPEPEEDLAAVARRGRRHRAVGLATATAVVAGVVAVAGLVGSLLLGDDARPRIDQPDVVTSGAPTPSPQAPEGSAEDPVSVADLGWVATVYGQDGAVRYDGDGATRLVEGPVTVAFGLRDGSLVAQSGVGEPIVHVGTGTEEEALGRTAVVENGQGQALLRVTQDLEEVQVWFSLREGEGEDQRQTLWRMGMEGTGTEPLGDIGGYETGTDALDVSVGRVAYLTCHLQCQIAVAPSPRDVGDVDAEQRLLPGDWLGGLDLSPDGDLLATVNYRFDPEDGEPSSGALVVLDTATWQEVARVELPELTGWGHHVAFTPSGTDVVVGNPSGRGWFVGQVAGAAPTARRLAESGTVTFHGPGAPTVDPDPARALWPEIGAEAAARAEADGAVERDAWRRQPFGVAARFVADELGWDPPVVTLVHTGDGYALVEAGGHGTTLRFELVQPPGSRGWWIAYASRRDASSARWDTAIEVSLSRTDGRLEVGAGSRSAGDGRVELHYRDTAGTTVRAPDGDGETRLRADVATDAAGSLLVVVRGPDGTLRDLLLTGVPAAPFAAG